MVEQVEIEYKTMLTEKEYHQLLAYYKLSEKAFKTQTNYYFDTQDFKLREKHFGLRIRTTPTNAELTLKTPIEHGLLETTDPLTIETAASLIASEKILKTGVVAQRLKAANIEPDSLHMIAALKTKRAEFPINEGLLALDESWYGQQHDYELELEVSEPIQGKFAFQSLLHSFGIPYRPAKNKIIRAVEEKSL